MLIEALAPLTVRLAEGDIRLFPGKPVDWPEERALKLLARAPGKVRAITAASHVGQIVTWESPIFGQLTATVLAETDQTVTVWHPLTERDATIPKALLVMER